MTSLPKHQDASFSNQSGVLSANTGGGPQNNNHFGIQYNFGKDNKVLVSHGGGVEEAQESLNNKILQSLAFPHMLDRRDSIERPHAHTCQWIFELENYKSWRNQSSGLLWIKGKAGAGKSTLMLCLHEELKKLHESPRGIQIEFFFTARGAEIQHIPLGMFRSLLNQIFDADENVQTPVRDAYTERCRKFGDTKGQWEWSQQTLADLLANAILTSAKDQDVTIFVDALDETGSESAEMMANYFHELNNRAERAGRRVKICISCRHYPIVGNPTATEITVEQHNSADITRYIENTLGGNSQQVADRDQWKGLVDELIKQASGMFQWAKIVAPIISRQIKEKKSREKIRAWLKRVPPDLEGVYQYILSEVIPDDDQGEAFLFFQWLHLAQRPLTVTEMRYAMAMANTKVVASLRRAQEIEGLVENNEAMKTRVKVLSGGLAEVTQSDTNDEIIQVIHQSVNDFLHDKGLASLASKVERTTLPAAQVLNKCQARLYHSCLKYLAIVEVTIQKLEDVPMDEQEEYVKSQPFLSYATLNLLVHGEKAANFRTNELRNEIQLLEQIVGKWTRVYGVLDRYGPSRPPTGTTVMHMAATANLLNVMENLASNKQNVSRIDNDGKTPLHLAARQGHITGAKLLREKGAGTEAIGKDGRTPIVEAASHGHKELIEWLLKSDAKVDGSGKGAGTALQEASLNGQLVVVDLLLEKGADVNAQGGEYGNALQAASWVGSVEVVQMLLDAKADVNAQGGEYGNALQAASWVGSVEVVQMLLDAKADVNAQGGEYGNALQAASWRGSVEVVQMLLDAKADVNAQGGQYGNALQAASLDGSAEVVQMLLDAKADVNAQSGEYGNALEAASYNGHSKVVWMLLDAKADVNAQGGQYGNALQAASLRGSAEVVQMLLDAKADVNAQGGHFGNALQAASWRGNAAVVQILLDAKADVNAQGGHFGNALQAASWRGNAAVVQILLDAKADVNTQGGEYGYPLLAAVYQGFVHTVDSLLQTGANPELSDHLDRTPLHIAASKNMLHILRKHPCLASTINAQDRFSRTPLQLAIIHGHTRFALALLELGADPYLLDGYGRNSLDWAADNLQLAAQLRNAFPAIAPTDNELQRSMVRRSIHQISATLLASDYHHSWALLQQLGHYLMFLKDEDSARLIFNLDLSQEYLSGIKSRVTCDICDEPIYGTRVICRVCANLDLCLSCRHKHPTHGRLNAPQAHDVLEVPYEQPPDSQQARQRLNDLLRRFSLQFGGPSMPGSITTTVTEPSPQHPVFLQYSGPQALAYPVFVGILVTSFCTWYFHYRK